jgi:hypothetical protein
MSSELIRYFIHSSLIAFSLLSAHFAVQQYVPAYHFNAAIPLIAGFYLLYNLLHFLLLKILTLNPGASVNAIMGLMGFKMLFLMLLVVVWLAADPDNAVPFLSVISASYLLFTAHDIIKAYSLLKNHKS